MKKIRIERLSPRSCVFKNLYRSFTHDSFLLISGTLRNCFHHKESYVTKY